jgi:hypothetical protein
MKTKASIEAVPTPSILHSFAPIVLYRSIEDSSINHKNQNENIYGRNRMNRRSLIAIGLTLLIISAIIMAFELESMPRTPKTAIRIKPESIARLTLNETFTVNVTVENCVDVYAVQVDIRYDPRVLNATNIVEGPFLRSAGPTILLMNISEILSTNPPTARVFFVETKSGEKLPDANGAGTLLTITFQVLSDNSTQLGVFPYAPASGLSEGTYFMKRDHTEIIPELHNGQYS